MKITFRDQPVVFVDLEASGIHVGSYPIEVGWSTDDEHTPHSFLIRPAPDWTLRDFSLEAYNIHRIPYDTLVAEGVDLETARARLASAWAGKLLVSDNPPSDLHWLTRLYSEAGQPCPWRLIDFDVVDAALANEAGETLETLAKVINAADRCWPVPHRAGPDAQRLHKIARAIVDRVFRAALDAP